MKITLTFLFLGICLALTNAFPSKKKKMTELEGFSHCRMMSLVMKRWNDWQNCHRCTDIERFCLEKMIVEDLCFIVKLMTNDLGYTLQQFLGKATFHIEVTIIITAVDDNNSESLARTLRAHGLLNHFVQTICGLMNAPLKESNMDMGNILSEVNNILGGVLGTSLDLVTGVLGGLVGTGIGAVTGALEGALGGVTGALGGVTGALGGVTGALGGALGGVTGGIGGLTSGFTGNLLGAKKGGLLG